MFLYNSKIHVLLAFPQLLIASLPVRQKGIFNPDIGISIRMFALLPGLQEIHYEPWREWLNIHQMWTNQCECYCLYNIFWNRFLALNYRDSSSSRISTKLTQLATRVGRLLTPVSHLNTSQCRSWEKLAIFSKLENFPGSNWPNLTWLALTSRLLVPRERSAELDDMLQAAAAAAMNMPNLETMEKWNGEKGLAMLFRYQRNKRGQPAAWYSVSLKHCGQGNVIIKELLDISDSIKSHGDAIHHLELSKPVVRPASLRQIQMMHTV
ncbi:hypothetical protein EAE99_006880 [Botrytis elliptica]|nr:hypothetical protein EAE99_006880 [Botrytis elliptica]